MGRRKGKKQNPETLTFSQIENEVPKIVEEEDGTGSKGKFFACYLLTSLCPRFKGHTYIGFTVNPKRRIRQHNGEIGSGAWRTKKKRPWEMVLCIYGFPTNVAALQFEWAWQHPVESLAVRKAAVNFKSLSGLANKIKLAYTMVTLEAWQSLNLTVNFFSTKYQKHIAGCPSLPKQMRVQVCSMDELPCYTGSIEEDDVLLDDAYDSSSDGCLKTANNEEIDEEVDHCLAVRQHSLENSKLGRLNASQEVTHEPSVCMDEACFSEPRHSSITDTLPPFQLYDECCPLSDKSFSPPRYNDMVNNAEEIGIFKSNCSNEYSQFSNNLRPITIIEDTDTYPPPGMSKAVEVIDLFTPSPCLRVSKANKRRWSSEYPEIIDLTESPLFV